MNEPSPDRRSAPHPVLAAFYRNEADRAPFVRSLFDRTAIHYDRINQLMSAGTGAWFRRVTLRRAGLQPGMRLLDLAIGTGLVAREAVAIVGRSGQVVGLDVSAGMLHAARQALAIPLIQGRAESLPVSDGSFDFVTMGYALRHVSDLEQAFGEMRRVLRPDGTVVILEISRPATRAAHVAARVYLGRIVPLLSRLVTRTEETQTLMRYYWDTIENCLDPVAIQSAMQRAGLADVRTELTGGMFRTYTGRRPTR